MRPKLARILALSALAVLAGCATIPESVNLPEMGTWDARNKVLGSIENWEFKGRIAVKAGDDGFNGKISWTQQGDTFHATVGGPLGMGTVRIAGDGQTIRLIDKDGVEVVLHEPELELRWRYGWTIPVESLRYWALGIPDPGLPAVTAFDGAGLLIRLEQSDWVVEITSYRKGGGQQMPRMLSATNPDTRVKMVIDRWLFFDR